VLSSEIDSSDSLYIVDQDVNSINRSKRVLLPQLSAVFAHDINALQRSENLQNIEVLTQGEYDIITPTEPHCIL